MSRNGTAGMPDKDKPGFFSNWLGMGSKRVIKII